MAGFHTIDSDSIRHLRDGEATFPAMLDAIDQAEREILLEMYWVGDDAVGRQFRDRLVARALDGVRVFVTYDGVGSLGLFRSFWTKLVEAGGHVSEIGPVAPWRRGFSVARLFFRDHRKLLVVDGEVGFCGGLNLALPWLPLAAGGANWRDDALEIRGPAALRLRALVCDTWAQLRRAGPLAGVPARPESPTRTSIIANTIALRPNRRIRRTYLLAIARARASIDIANPYFLPGPRFLRALRKAHRRGVRVRLIVPGIPDVWLVSLAMQSVVDQLVRDGIHVFMYARAVLHAKTMVLDRNTVVIGSHNLDSLSWRFNLEANVLVDDAALAADVSGSFERDLSDSIELLPSSSGRPWYLVALGWLVSHFRRFL